MFNNYSDLPRGKLGETNVIIARPELAGLLKREQERIHDLNAMSMVFENAYSLHGLKHAGLLTIDSYARDPLCFAPCKGNLIFYSARELQSINKLGERKDSLLYQRPNLVTDSNMAVVCDDHECKAEFVLNLTREQCQSLIFHLMIKQMIPALQSCCYIDCSKKEDDYQQQEIRQLGLISLNTDILHGQMALRKNFDWFALGFMLTDKMKTLDSCDGFDQWLKLLFLKKMDQIKQVLDLNSAILRGPKQKH